MGERTEEPHLKHDQLREETASLAQDVWGEARTER